MQEFSRTLSRKFLDCEKIPDKLESLMILCIAEFKVLGIPTFLSCKFLDCGEAVLYGLNTANAQAIRRMLSIMELKMLKFQGFYMDCDI